MAAAIQNLIEIRYGYASSRNDEFFLSNHLLSKAAFLTRLNLTKILGTVLTACYEIKQSNTCRCEKADSTSSCVHEHLSGAGSVDLVFPLHLNSLISK